MKRIGIILGVIVGVLALGFAAATILIKPDKIKAEALARIRAASGYEIEAGDASLKVSFTGAGIRVENISFSSPDSSRSGRVEDVDVLVKIFPLLQKRVELNRLVIHSPVYRQRQTPPKTGTPAENGNPALAFFAVESWEIQDGTYEQSGDFGNVAVSGLDLEGGLRFDPETGGEGSARGTAQRILLTTPKGTWDLPELRTGAAFSVTPEADGIEITELDLASGDLRAIFSGEFNQAGAVWEGRLAGRVDPVAWDALAPFLPEAAAAPLEPWTVSGTVAVPEIEVLTGAGPARTSGMVEITNLSAKHEEAPLGITETHARIQFTPEAVRLDEAAGKVGEDAFTVTGSFEPATGSVAMDLDSRLSAANLGGLIPKSAPLSLTRGNLVLDLAFRGKTPFEGLPDISGRVVGERIEGSVRDLPLQDAGGTIRFTGRAAEIQDLFLKLGDSDLALNGTVPDLRDPRMNFTLRSTTLDLNQLFPEEKKSAASPESGKEEEPMMVGLPGKGSIQVGTLKFRKFRVEDIRSRASLDVDGVALQDLTGRLYGGEVQGNLRVVPAETPGEWRYQGAFDMKHVQAASLILGWNPAGALVEGDLGGHLDLAGKAGQDIDPRRSFRLDGTMDVTEGALVNFSGLAALGSALKIKDVDARRWPFRSLGVQFKIEDGNLVLDTMQMAQAGIGWDMQGRIGLTGDLQLTGTANLDPDKITLPGEIAWLAPYMVEDNGRIPVDFLVGGTLEKPNPQLDWKAVTERAAAKAKKQEGQKIEQKLQDTLKKKIFGGGG